MTLQVSLRPLALLWMRSGGEFMAINISLDSLKSKFPTKPKGHLPTKRDINFAMMGVETINMKIAVPAIVVICIGAALFSKFAVVDRMAYVSRVQSEVSALRSQIETCYQEIQSFDEVKDAYAHYTYSDFSDEELVLADRKAIMSLIDTYILNRVGVSDWSLNQNQLNMTITGAQLKEVNKIVEELENTELVNFCTVTTATSGDSYSSKSETSTIKLTVYLNKADLSAYGRGSN